MSQKSCFRCLRNSDAPVPICGPKFKAPKRHRFLQAEHRYVECGWGVLLCCLHTQRLSNYFSLGYVSDTSRAKRTWLVRIQALFFLAGAKQLPGLHKLDKHVVRFQPQQIASSTTARPRSGNSDVQFRCFGAKKRTHFGCQIPDPKRGRTPDPKLGLPSRFS